MAARTRSTLSTAVEQVLTHREGRTAREIARDLRKQGHEGVDKAAVNAVLYRGARKRFWPDSSSPPRWFTTADQRGDAAEAPSLRALTAFNWKSFSGSAQLLIAPLTLVYGANSAGKSSLIQSLLTLKQSADVPGLLLDGPYFSGGGFANVVHGHDVTRATHLGVVIDDGDDEAHALSRVVQLDHDAGEPKATAVLLALGEEIFVFGRTDPEDEEPYWAHTGHDTRDVLDVVGIPRPDAEVTRTAFFRDDGGWPGELYAINLGEEAGHVSVRAKRAWAELLDRERSMQANLLRRIQHLGPMREVPLEWVPALPDPDDAQLGSAAVVRRLASEPDLLEDVNEWLARLEVPYDVSIARTTDDDSAAAVLGLRLQRRGVTSGEVVRVQDVGYGVGQLLPIVVVALGTKDSVILVEQPEVHLHPRLQSRVADLLVTSARDYGNRLVVETHSEHLLLRLQRRIAEKQLDHELLHVAYVDRLGDTATIEELEVDEDGQLVTGWPEGFFDSRFDDLLAIADPDVPA